MGDAAPAHEFESAAAVLEQGLHSLLEKFNANVKEQIAATIEVGLQRIGNDNPPTEKANAVGEQALALLQSKVDSLTTKVAKLQKELANATKTRNSEEARTAGSATPTTNHQARAISENGPPAL